LSSAIDQTPQKIQEEEPDRCACHGVQPAHAVAPFFSIALRHLAQVTRAASCVCGVRGWLLPSSATCPHTGERYRLDGGVVRLIA
jgi:hypothetical protein